MDSRAFLRKSREKQEQIKKVGNSRARLKGCYFLIFPLLVPHFIGTVPQYFEDMGHFVPSYRISWQNTARGSPFGIKRLA